MDTPTPSSPIDDVSTSDETPDAPKPSLFLSDAQIDDAGLGDCQVGDSYTATINFKVTAVSDQGDQGRNKTLEVESITDATPAGEADKGDETPDETSDNTGSAEPDESDSVLGFTRPKPKPGVPVDLKKLRE